MRYVELTTLRWSSVIILTSWGRPKNPFDKKMAACLRVRHSVVLVCLSSWREHINRVIASVSLSKKVKPETNTNKADYKLLHTNKKSTENMEQYQTWSRKKKGKKNGLKWDGNVDEDVSNFPILWAQYLRWQQSSWQKKKSPFLFLPRQQIIPLYATCPVHQFYYKQIK